LAIVTAKGKEIKANLVNDMFNAPKSKIDKNKQENVRFLKRNLSK